MTDLSPACDYPTCVGGECSYDCERYVKHLEWCKEEYSERIETLTREKAALEEECKRKQQNYRKSQSQIWGLNGRIADWQARAEAAESALREALDVVRALIPEGWGDGTMDHMPGIEAARAFIEKHSS